MTCKRCGKPVSISGRCLYWRCLRLRGLERRKLTEHPVTFDDVRRHCTLGIISKQNDYGI
jgi:hypothetical protein